VRHNHFSARIDWGSRVNDSDSNFLDHCCFSPYVTVMAPLLTVRQSLWPAFVQDR